MNKKLRAVLLATIIASSTVMTQAAPHVFLNGEKVSLDKPVIVNNNRTFLPLRTVSETLGAKVDWNSKTRTITITSGYNTISLLLGSKDARVNNRIVTLDVAPFAKDGTTYVPVRFVADCLNIPVDYYAQSQIVSLITDTSKATEIKSELSSIKEVITNAEDLNYEAITKYGNAFTGKSNLNPYTMKPLDKVAVVNYSDLPIQIGDVTFRDIYFNKDGSLTVHWNLDSSFTRGWRIKLSDKDGIVRVRDSDTDRVDSKGVHISTYLPVTLSDFDVDGDNFLNYTFDRVNYFIVISNNKMIAIPKAEVR